MSSSALHRTRRGSGLRRVGTAALVGAASLATFGPAAQPAAAAESNVWDRVADCESSGNWAINSGNGFYGGLQFWHPTWTSFGGQEFAPYAHQATKVQQITIGQRVLKVQGPGAWPVCSVRAGLTMSNGLAPYPGQGQPAPAPGTSGTWYVSATPGANIRSGPSTSYAVVGTAATGTKITGTMSNGWVKISDGRYISGSTLTTSAPAPTPAPTPPSTGGTWWVASSAGANIRSGPGTNYSVVGGAAQGTKITGSLSNGWVKIQEGRWIAQATLTTTAPGVTTPTVADTWKVSATLGANIRSGPGTNYSVIGGAAQGTAVTGTLNNNGWVKLADRDGWISASILTKTS